MASPLRLALVGLGRMGRFHAEALQGVEEVEVVAIADPMEPALEAARSLFPRAAAYDDPRAAFEHDHLEACLLATPTPTHADLTAAALELGLHVLCEKPLSLDPADGVRLDAVARANGRVVQIGFWRRF